MERVLGDKKREIEVGGRRGWGGGARERQTDRQTDRQRQRETERHKVRDTETDTETDRQTDPRMKRCCLILSVCLQCRGMVKELGYHVWDDEDVTDEDDSSDEENMSSIHY